MMKDAKATYKKGSKSSNDAAEEAPKKRRRAEKNRLRLEETRNRAGQLSPDHFIAHYPPGDACPGGHGRHMCAPISATLPAAHAAHVDDPNSWVVPSV